MYSHCLTYPVFFALVLTQKFAFARVENVMHHEIDPAKIGSSILKVPWINLNSSWNSEVNLQCKNDTMTLFGKADSEEMWALKMLDASSKIPSGILTGNIIDLGIYDECVGVKSYDNPENIQGQHCMVSMSIPTKFIKNASEMLSIQRMVIYNPSANVDFSLTLSVCLPSTCGSNDIKNLVEAYIQSTAEFTELQVKVIRVLCSGVDSSDDSTMGFILTMTFIASIAGLLLFCTACDFIVKRGPYDESSALKTLAKFSLYSNGLKLMSTQVAPGNMRAINGIRILSMFFVIVFHRAMSALMTILVNFPDFYSFREKPQGVFLMMMPYAVDTFFIIAGFLATHSFLKKMQRGVKFDLPMFYLHRYIRLTPCIIVLTLVTIFIIPRLGSGPLWPVVLEYTVDHCRKNWWLNLLYVQNFVNQYELCFPHTWYLAVEMQLYLISPVILLPLFYRPKLGLSLLGALSVASFITPAVTVIVHQYAFLLNANKTFYENYKGFLNNYIVTYNRALPYFVGIFLGYYKAHQKKRLTKIQMASNWVLACICTLYCSWNISFIVPFSTVYNTMWEALHVSVGRLAWSLAMAWILYASTQGYGGPVTRFLSLPIFVPLSRLSYGVYLSSFVLQAWSNATVRTAEFYSTFAVFSMVLGDSAISIAVAVVLNLCIETPVIILEEIWRAKPSTVPNICRPAFTISDIKRKDEMGEHSDLTRGPAGLDSAVATEMMQLDFWATRTDMLTNLSKKPAKTPAEWTKTWQEWRSNETMNASEQPSRGNNIQNSKLQAEKTTPEQELLKFLVAVNCGSDDAASCKKSE